MICTSRSSSTILGGFKVLRPPKGWHKRDTKKAKDPKIPKILQKRETRALLELSGFNSSKYNIY